jgi:hypothetical protein
MRLSLVCFFPFFGLLPPPLSNRRKRLDTIRPPLPARAMTLSAMNEARRFGRFGFRASFQKQKLLNWVFSEVGRLDEKT